MLRLIMLPRDAFSFLSQILGKIAMGGDKQMYFYLVGLVSSREFQRSKAYLEILYRKLPEYLLKPSIHPMLEYEWREFMAKAKHRHCSNFFGLKKPVAVFIDHQYLGDDFDLISYLTDKFNIHALKNWCYLAQKNVLEIYQDYMQLGRKFVYLTLSIDGRQIGTLIFMLYADLVPKTADNFIRKCNARINGYAGSIMHRIMKNSWIQFGGEGITSPSRSCENYKIAHNRRGVLSMCNDGRNRHNTGQFFVTLSSTPWMDFKYVAFGQMIQGERVLQNLEAIPTFYEAPQAAVRIDASGEITLQDTFDASEFERIERYLQRRDKEPKTRYTADKNDVASMLLETNYNEGKYYFECDAQTHSMTEFVRITDSTSFCGDHGSKDEVPSDLRTPTPTTPTTPTCLLTKTQRSDTSIQGRKRLTQLFSGGLDPDDDYDYIGHGEEYQSYERDYLSLFKPEDASSIIDKREYYIVGSGSDEWSYINNE